MNYAGFLRPVWSWLRESHLEDPFYDIVTRERTADEAIAAMILFRAGVLVDRPPLSGRCSRSHDTPRFATVVPSRDHRLVGIGMQMTTPGVPMLFAGDEIGLEGLWGEDGRRTIRGAGATPGTRRF